MTQQKELTRQAPRVILAATHSGSGKTMLTIGLLAAYRRMGLALSAFKCGPDYIDPMFHSRVLGIPSRNLDGYFTDAAVTRALFAQAAAPEDGLSLIEGVMGYFDGVASSLQGSACALADTLEAPVVLVIDAAGMSLSAAAELQGFLNFHKPSRIAGVIFNRTTAGVYETLRPLAEAMGVRACGYLPRLKDLELPSRHLGLVTPDQIQDLRAYTDRLADTLMETVDLEAILALARDVPPIRWREPELPRLSRKLNISVAKDEAFCFLYEDNLAYLEKIGGACQFFSPLHDTALPQNTDVLLLPGGYPELYAKQLSENTAMRSAIHKALADGIFVLAECGGFLYLTRAIRDVDGGSYPMVGRIHTEGIRGERLQRFGYVELTEVTHSGENAWIRGHEFHYYDTDQNGVDFIAKKPNSTRSWPCMHASDHELIGFPHLYYYSNPLFLYERLEEYLQTREHGQ